MESDTGPLPPPFPPPPFEGDDEAEVGDADDPTGWAQVIRLDDHRTRCRRAPSDEDW